jgi:hypothetical protein
MASNNTNDFEVFVSYQWDSDAHITSLLKNLADRYIFASRDKEQLKANNDGLFKQLGEQIKKAKVFLCCLTDKYTKSANCLKELNFAAKIGKSIIYLMIDKMSVQQLETEVAFIMGNSVYVHCYKHPDTWFDLDIEEIYKNIKSTLEVK